MAFFDVSLSKLPNLLTAAAAAAAVLPPQPSPIRSKLV
jgi:hypothetical protein